MSFRFAARKAFLTYPQCPLTQDEVHDKLDEIQPIQWCIIAQEQHADGNPHIHVAVIFEKKLNMRSPNGLDLSGYHCNIQAPKNWPATINYVKKDGNYKEYGTNTTYAAQQSSSDNLYDNAKTMDEIEFFNWALKERIPYQYANRAWNAEQSLFTIYEDYVEPPEAEVDDRLTSIDLSFSNFDNRSISIVGRSGIGKSTWAIRVARKPALLVTHIDTLKHLTKKHKAIIFDDISFNHWPRESQIHIVDRFLSRAIHIRYGVANIPAGIQKIFTNNYDPFLDDEAINRRVQKIKIY